MNSIIALYKHEFDILINTNGHDVIVVLKYFKQRGKRVFEIKRPSFDFVRAMRTITVRSSTFPQTQKITNIPGFESNNTQKIRRRNIWPQNL